MQIFASPESIAGGARNCEVYLVYEKDVHVSHNSFLQFHFPLHLHYLVQHELKSNISMDAAQLDLLNVLVLNNDFCLSSVLA